MISGGTKFSPVTDTKACRGSCEASIAVGSGPDHVGLECIASSLDRKRQLHSHNEEQPLPDYVSVTRSPWPRTYLGETTGETEMANPNSAAAYHGPSPNICLRVSVAPPREANWSSKVTRMNDGFVFLGRALNLLQVLESNNTYLPSERMPTGPYRTRTHINEHPRTFKESAEALTAALSGRTHLKLGWWYPL